MPRKGIFKPVEDRFWPKVNRSGGPNACWEWLAHRNASGYGVFRTSSTMHGKTGLAHRFAWQLSHGEIPDGLFVCHSCDNRGCCNPSHMFVGTNHDNVQDKMLKGRHVSLSGAQHPLRIRPERAARGERCRKAVLTESAVRRIQQLLKSGASRREIAAEYGVTRETIGNVANGKTWRHVTGL